MNKTLWSFQWIPTKSCKTLWNFKQIPTKFAPKKLRSGQSQIKPRPFCPFFNFFFYSLFHHKPHLRKKKTPKAAEEGAPAVGTTKSSCSSSTFSTRSQQWAQPVRSGFAESTTLGSFFPLFQKFSPPSRAWIFDFLGKSQPLSAAFCVWDAQLCQQLFVIPISPPGLPGIGGVFPGRSAGGQNGLCRNSPRLKRCPGI